MDKVKNSAVPLIEFHTGNKIPQVGLGTYQMRGIDCLRAVQVAIEKGYRHIDTASIYQNESDIAKALKELYSSKVITREELFITSKIGPSEQGYDKAIAACNSILKKLETPYLDLLIIHWPGVSGVSPSSAKNAEVRLETWKALEQLKKEGKVKDIGVSNFLVSHLEHLLKHSKTKPVLNQFEIHPFCFNNELIDFCQKENIVIEAYSSLARNEEILTKNKYLETLSKKYNKTIAQIALKWGLQNNFVILPKSKTEKFIDDNIQLFDFELSEDEVKKITSLNKDYHTCWDPATIKH